MERTNIGIIPAAGKSTRFGGLFKELLPLPDGRSLLEHAVDRLDFCDRIVVVTNFEKAEYHQRLLGKNRKVLLQQQMGKELWGAIRTAYNSVDGDRYFMTMPDTYIGQHAFSDPPTDSFGLGYFITNEPNRFGILQDGFVTDKYQDARIPATAWGVLTWAKHICDLWNDREVEDYTQAINTAIMNGDWGKWPIGEYWDIANMQRYMELLWHLREI
jgi:hypothetical protein